MVLMETSFTTELQYAASELMDVTVWGEHVKLSKREMYYVSFELYSLVFCFSYFLVQVGFYVLRFLFPTHI